MTTRAINGAAVKVIREALGITQHDLAARSQIAQGTLSNLERGIHQASPQVARKLADSMGVPLESITYPLAECEHAGIAS
jgi:transcriptional regulator with XRE-family HTH domain